MQIKVKIPPKKKILTGGYSVPVAQKGKTWTENTLGLHAKRKGVYIIHHKGKIKYVGKTDGPKTSFGIRLRREFQEGASQGRHIYPKLRKLKVPPDIMVYFFTTDKIRSFISATGVKLTDTQRIEIFEIVLQQAYKPQFMF